MRTPPKAVSPGGRDGPQTFVGGRFQVRRQIGFGAQGTVFEVYDTQSDCVMALKVLSRAEPNLLYRFKREFREIAEIVHPRLATLYEFFGGDGVFCFTMELLQGEDWLSHVAQSTELEQDTMFEDFDAGGAVYSDERTLAPDELHAASHRRPRMIEASVLPPVIIDSLQDGLTRTGKLSSAPPLPERSTRSVPPPPSSSPSSGVPVVPAIRPHRVIDEARLRTALRELVEGVSAMHAAGKVHLDLKPSNVLVRPTQGVCILDFGLAQPLSEPGKAGAVVGGTPRYMAPEQVQGEASPACDWYAVGVMLYEALTGGLPFSGNSYAIAALKQTRTPVHPVLLVDGIPGDLADLCMRLLATRPSDRADATEVRRALGLEASRVDSPARRIGSATGCFGREHELEQLVCMYGHAKSGGLHVALVRGVSGIGKSTVVEAFLDQLVDDGENAWMLRGRCYENEFMPYRGFDGLMDNLCAELGELDAHTLSSLLPVSFSALTDLFPVLRRISDVGSGDISGPGSTPLEARKLGVSALRELLIRLRSERPIVLYIDDMQWADVDTLRLVQDLFAPPNGPSVMLIMTARDEELAEQPALQDALRVLNEWASGFVLLDVPHLSIDSLEALAASEYAQVPPEVRKRLVTDAGGSPFLLLELLGAAAAGVQGSVEEILLRRAHAHGARASGVIETLALAGRPLAAEVLADCVASIPGSEHMPALIAQLKAERLVRVRSGAGRERLECYHDRIRESVTTSVPTQTAVSRHAHLARALIAREYAPEDVVPHLVASGDRARVPEYARLAAESSAGAFAFDRAAHFLSLIETYGALQGLPLAELQAERARHLVHAGHTLGAAPLLLQAARMHPDALALRREAAHHLLAGGQISRGMKVAEAVLTGVGVRMPKTQVGAILMMLASELAMRLRRYRLAPRPTPDRAEALAQLVDIYHAFACGFNVTAPAHSAAFFAKAARLALALGDAKRAAISLGGHVGMVAAFSPRRAERLLDHGFRFAKSANDELARQYTVAGEAFRHYFDFNFSRALSLAEGALRVFASLPVRHRFEEERMHLVAMLSRVPLARPREVAGLLPKLTRSMERRGDEYGAALLNASVGTFSHLALGQPEVVSRSLVSLDGLERDAGDYLSFYEGFSRVSLALYVGGAQAALDHLHAYKRAWWRSGITRIAIGFITLRILECQLMARIVPQADERTRRRYLRAMRRHARVLRRRKEVFGRAAGAMIQASVHVLEGEREAAIMALGESEGLWESIEVEAYAGATRWLRGAMLGGPDGNALMQRSLRHLRDEGVVRPLAYLGIFMPFGKEILGTSTGSLDLLIRG